MPVPVVDIDELAVSMLPSEQRLPYWEIFAKAEASPYKNLYTLFTYYMQGSTDMGYWDVAASYSKGDVVRMLSGVYVSKTNSNTGNAVTNATYWLKVLNSFIGATERAKCTGRYLAMTWILNRAFGTTFRQPPYPSPYGGSGTFSDIYITTDAIVRTSFTMYPGAAASSKMYPTFSTGWLFEPPAYAAELSFKFTVHVPVAVYTALGSSAAIRESVVRNHVDKYNVTGITYTVATY
jgi:hypothetical protein